ncbi:TetR/AcrR family transcriptional regulator [Subtercola sp. YIM 133946]|uniref:TetR/AcrR family transcriptional regulator n=1 Tax=Subtercola sp. YIM 133946 TaxID=3118909 RepID=UPI002F931F32
MTGIPSPRRGAAREQAILDAASELIGELGYEKVTVDAIAARARSSKTTMYRRWPGKAELVADALRRRAESADAEVPDTGSLRGDLLATVEQIQQTLVRPSGPSLIGMIEAIRDDDTLREIIRGQVRERGHDVGRVICARAVTRGEELDPTRSDAVLDLAFSALFTETLLLGGGLDRHTLERLVDDALLPLLREKQRRA